jgi:hypothetical protein
MENDPQVPARLWKYRPWGDIARRLVVDGEIYFATVPELDDPFECQWVEHLPVSIEERDLYAREFCAKFAPTLDNEKRKLDYLAIMAWLESVATPENKGIIPNQVEIKYGWFCASEVCDSLLMWAHYAKPRHSGVCLSIQTRFLNDRRILPVKYLAERAAISAWDYIHEDRETFVQATTYKSPEWSYEREWRTVGIPGPLRRPGIVDRVIIGAGASDAARGEIREAAAAAAQPIEVVDARLAPKRYRLYIPEFRSRNKR